MREQQPARPKAHIPTTVSPEAQEVLREWDFSYRDVKLPSPDDLAAWKIAWDLTEEAWTQANDDVQRAYEPTIRSAMHGGVPVLDVQPKGWRENARVLVYTHGGAYTMFSARSTLTSAVPVANDTGLRVISVDYTPAPFARYEETTRQVLAVVKALLDDGRSPKDIAIYGDSAGGALAAGSVLRMRDENVDMPAAVVLLSPWSDITASGDTYETLKDADLLLNYDNALKASADAYADPRDQKHPYVSPVYADYGKGFPPTLIQGGTKEIFLSNFVRLYQVLDQAGIPVKLDLYEGMWHVFQGFSHALPESMQARRKMAAFLQEHLG